MKKLIALSLAAALTTAAVTTSNPTTAEAASFGDSVTASATGSMLSVLGPVMILKGSAEFVATAGQYTVEAVSHIGNATLIVLRNASDGAEVVIRASGRAGERALLATGEMVRTVVTGTGILLVSSGNAIITFVANNEGAAMYHHSEHLE